MSGKFRISPAELTIAEIEEITESGIGLELSDESFKLTDRCRKYLDRKLEMHEAPIYGVTTGFGSLYGKTISSDQLSMLQRNLVMSHACGTGNEVSEEIVRLMLLLKIHALSLGYSGVQPETIRILIDFYNRGVHPVVFEYGSLGASGDLAPLAHLVLPLLGMGEVRYKGSRMPAEKALEKLKMKPVDLRSKEGLALLNGTQFMSAHGVRAIIMAGRLARAADAAGAISLEAYDGRTEPFNELLHRLRPHNGQLETASSVRKMLEGSSIASRSKKHVQDPYSFRCIPQVHGATRDAISYCGKVLTTEINSVTDNPTVFPEEDMVLSGGNFHGQPLALVFDYLAAAIAELGSISERRIYRLISGHRNLPEFLVANPGLNSGFMIPQYTAASLVSRNKQLCTPTSVDSIPSSNEQEDHVSMGANGATRLLTVLDNTYTIIGIELFTAIQAMEFRRPLRSSAFIENIIAEFRRKVAFIEDDRVMYPEIEKASRFAREFRF
ncbi:MAG: histidine ammonia-lyase [Bacteroidales bacterium]|jgi:histidine ammonia-lyase|nr:histidine ammonia-lyase [Bacteroidales bacterium]